MRHRMSFADICFNIFNYSFMLFMIIITLYPIWFILVASFSSTSAISKHGAIMFWPSGFNIDYYRSVFQNERIWSGYGNTIILVVANTLLNLLTSSFGAYTLSRRWVMGKGIMTVFITIPMFFGGGLVPYYLLIRNQLGLADSLLALILPGVVSSWNIILMRTYFKSLGDSMEESGKLDGANDFQILFLLILPVAMPVVAYIALGCVVGTWNAWFDASLFIKSREKFPLQLVLRGILITGTKTEMGEFNVASGAVAEFSKGLKYATIIVSTVPILMFYPFLQKYFVKGIMLGSLKG